MKMKNHKLKCHGFTLVEVLVAMVILAIAMLGLSGLVTTGIGQNQLALSDSQALLLLEDMSNRIKANSVAVNSYRSTELDTGDQIVVNTDCSVNNCNAQQLAAYDLFEWVESVESIINPDGDQTVLAFICQAPAVNAKQHIINCPVNPAVTAPWAVALTWGANNAQRTIAISLAL